MNAGDKALLMQLIIQTRCTMLYIESFRMTEPYATKEQRDEYIDWLKEQTSSTHKMLELANHMLEIANQYEQIEDDNGSFTY